MTVELAHSTPHAWPGQEFAALYAQAQHFYAHQMQLLDTHDTHSWAATFTKDAVLELPFLPGPVAARTGLARYERAGAARLRQAGARLHHWVGMLDIRPRPEGSLHTRCSALVHTTPPQGSSKVLYVCVMQDVLVRTHGTWRTAHRRVTRDDLT
ncbi:nuclear transport factor 2 family protein [Streptomyces sp. NPDC005551]|uniref:nuclear transport factor 2 family protein n=1 Tax=unclassified Streptomyces TaxID=2593676 RepID=UPI0033E5978C